MTQSKEEILRNETDKKDFVVSVDGINLAAIRAMQTYSDQQNAALLESIGKIKSIAQNCDRSTDLAADMQKILGILNEAE